MTKTKTNARETREIHENTAAQSVSPPGMSRNNAAQAWVTRRSKKLMRRRRWMTQRRQKLMRRRRGRRGAGKN
jgi:hypothetical protein